VELREKVAVRSIDASRGLDVSVLRDLVAALDHAQIPSRAPVKATIADGRVTQLVVEADLDPEQQPPAAAEGGEQQQ
jgi:hypothetical protein